MQTPALTKSLDTEREFFDKEASALAAQELLIPTPADVERYRNAKLSAGNLSKDALFALLNPLHGKKVLDYGCGHGENACLLAACGAHVTAFDLSPGSIEQARNRAHIHGLADRIQFDVRAAGATGYADQSFDVVAGFAILHHLHTMLPAVFDEVYRVLRPGGVAAFIEPVADSRILAKIRHALPVPCYATPDERQLTDGDFAPMRARFSEVRALHFEGLARLRRLVGNSAAKPLVWVDHWALRILPPLRRFYGRIVIVGHRPAAEH